MAERLDPNVLAHHLNVAMSYRLVIELETMSGRVLTGRVVRKARVRDELNYVLSGDGESVPISEVKAVRRSSRAV